MAVVAGILIFASGGDRRRGRQAAGNCMVGAGTTAAEGGGYDSRRRNRHSARGRDHVRPGPGAGARPDVRRLCDPETGRLMIPDYFVPSATVDVDNGGEPLLVSRGHHHRRCVRRADSDPVLDFITVRLRNHATAQVAETYENYTRMMNDLSRGTAPGGAQDPQRLGNVGERRRRSRRPAKAEEMGAFSCRPGAGSRTRARRGPRKYQGSWCHLSQRSGHRPEPYAPHHGQRRPDPAAARGVDHEEAEGRQRGARGPR